ncbi:MAG: RNA polymerase sigma factor [Ruminococcus sp.]|nr:RNA polymerase sigma factor [Ruminococcus sp.]
MEDKEIVALYWARDERALTHTKEKYDSYLYTVAVNILSTFQDAEECVSDTYVGAWNSMPPQKPAVLRTYLGRITRNLSLKRFRYLRAEKRYSGEADVALDELSEVLPDRESPYDEVQRQELVKVIQGFLTGLTSEQRMIFLMRYWYLATVSETARKLGFSQSKVKMTLKRTRDSLRELLEKEGWL